MSPSTLDNFNIQMRLELDGIGASLRSDDGYTVVQNIIPGGAADKDGGLKPEDKIVGVGEGAERPDGRHRRHEAQRRREEDPRQARHDRPPGSRAGRRRRAQDDTTSPATASSSRTAKPAARSSSAARRPTARRTASASSSCRASTWTWTAPGWACDDYKSTTRDVRRLLEEFKTKNVDAVVIDLRWNGGGSLTEAVNMTGLFIDEGPVVQVKGPDGRIAAVQRPGAGHGLGRPAGGDDQQVQRQRERDLRRRDSGLRPRHRRSATTPRTARARCSNCSTWATRCSASATMPNMGALKMTIQQFYRPGGDSTQNRGVVSDVELPSLTTHLDVGESDLDYALKFDQRRCRCRTTSTTWSTRQMVEGLRQRSQQRVGEVRVLRQGEAADRALRRAEGRARRSRSTRKNSSPSARSWMPKRNRKSCSTT